MTDRSKTVSYLVLLLALGANTLIVELVIPRMVAPVFGNTLFSWTAIIAVVLAMLTLGYRVGGMLAARVDIHRYIVWFSIGAAAWVLVLSVVGDAVVGWMSGLNLVVGPLVAALLLAAVPAFLDAAVVPMAIQAIEGERGEVSGRCFAWSTVGSILGVLLTGYVLLPQLGIAGALVTGVFGVAIGLAVIGRKLPAAGLAALGAGAMVVSGNLPTDGLLDMSNGYHRIRVTQSGEIRNLYLDNTLEGQVQLGSDRLVSDYSVRLGEMIEQHMLGDDGIENVFAVGGGSFSIPRYVAGLDPRIAVHVSEIDPDVVRVGRELLELGDGIEISIGDGRQVLKRTARRYDLVVNDAFQGVRKIPFHLVTREFNELVSERLTPDGVYAANVRGDPATSHLASSFIRTMAETFPFVYTRKATATNTWVLGSKTPLEWATPAPRGTGRARVLTDDHSPVEYLIVRDIVSERLQRMERG